MSSGGSLQFSSSREVEGKGKKKDVVFISSLHSYGDIEYCQHFPDEWRNTCLIDDRLKAKASGATNVA